MSRSFPLVVALAVLTAFATVLPHAAAKDIKENLRAKIAFPGDDEKVPLEDALEYLIDVCRLQAEFDLVLYIDVAAFEKVGMKKIREWPIPVSAQKGVQVKDVLRRLLEPIGATYQVEKGYVVIVPAKRK